jgi:hypothetical protein
MKTRFFGVLASAPIIALAACSGTQSVADKAPPPTAITPSPTPTYTGPLKLGSARTLTDPNTQFRVTVYAYRQPLHSQFPPERHGTTYAGADVKYCNLKSGQATSVSWGPWSLEYSDDTTVDAVDEWSAEWFDVSLYPAVGKTVPVGRCVRGWILFAAPKGKRPVRIMYSPDGDGTAPIPVTEWSVR